MRVMVFDVETTGIPLRFNDRMENVSNWPRVVQLAYQIYNWRTLETEIDTIIYPEGFTIPIDVSRIHGITTEMARENGADLSEVLHEFNQHLESCDLLAAHNMDFDHNVLGAEFIRKGFDLDYYRRINRFCTMRSSMEFCNLPGPYGLKWPRLEELHRVLFHCDFNGAHNALYDVKATSKCLFELIDLGIVSVSSVGVDV